MYIVFSTDMLEKAVINELYEAIVRKWGGKEEYTTRKGNYYYVHRDGENLVLEFRGKRSSLLDAKPLPFSFSWSNSNKQFASIRFNDRLYYFALEVTWYYTSTPASWRMRWYEELIPCRYFEPDEDGWRPISSLRPNLDEVENIDCLDQIPSLSTGIDESNCAAIYNHVTRTIRAKVKYRDAYHSSQ